MNLFRISTTVSLNLLTNGDSSLLLYDEWNFNKQQNIEKVPYKDDE